MKNINPKEKKASIGDRIKEIRNARHLTLQSFADILNTSPGFISDIEKGNKNPGNKIISSLKDSFDVNLNWLFTGKGKMFTPELSPINLVLLKKVIQAVEDIFIEKNISLQPNKKAELIVFLFEELLEDETKRQDLEERILRLMKFF